MSGLGNVARDVPAAGSRPVLGAMYQPVSPASSVPSLSLPRTVLARDVEPDAMTFSQFTDTYDNRYYPFFAESKFIMADVPRGVLRLASPTIFGPRLYKHRGEDFERGIHALWALQLHRDASQPSVMSAFAQDRDLLGDYPVFPYLSPTVMLAAARWRSHFAHLREAGHGSPFLFTQAGPAPSGGGHRANESYAFAVWDDFWLPRLSEFLLHVKGVPKGFAGSPDLSLIDAMRYPSRGGQPGAWAAKARLAVDTFLGK